MFVEIVEWVTSHPQLLMWKWPDSDKEIKNGAQLTVRESQTALLLSEGQIADQFGPGRHILSTENIPLLTRLKGWKHGFQSPFKVDVYFFNSHQFINLRWGTPAPIMLRDPQFGQVRVRAFGTFSVRIADVAVFFRQYAGTYEQLTIGELEAQLRDAVVPRFGEALAAANLSVLDVAGNVGALGARIAPMLEPYFAELGLALTQFQITSATLPPEVNAQFDKITGMNMVTDMDRFQQYNAANAIGQAGTAMNAGVQTAALLGAMVQQIQPPRAPAPTPPADDDITAKLAKLKALREADLIDEAEFRSKKEELLARL